MGKTKYDTEVIFIFVRGNGVKDWAVVREMSDTVHIFIPNENPNARAFCSEARHLKDWCESHGYDFYMETLDYTFAVEFKDTTFSEIKSGEQFTRVDCNQKFIRIRRTTLGDSDINAICLEGSHAGMQYLIGPNERVKE